MNKKTLLSIAALCAAATTTALFTGCSGDSSANSGISPQKMADALHLVMKSDRTVYTRNVVNRLVKQDKVIKASEHWADEQALPLPAQMFRMGAEMVAKESNGEFSYSLQSIWPINKQNAPKTEVEKAGLQYVADNPGENYYGEETLGGQKYFTGVYADTGVAAACIDCHNEHKDSPRTDFKMGEVMGGVVIRIPID
ncbi:DUF3365 domain-containing protein [Puniceicoccaceae bacterium K14]|nr:DUF3365 domain-containing protein [Puniceicoccaceae bacterium K14]